VGEGASLYQYQEAAYHYQPPPPMQVAPQEEGVGEEGMKGEEGEVGPPSFEGMLEAVMPLYKALLQAIAALGFRCVCVCLSFFFFIVFLGGGLGVVVLLPKTYVPILNSFGTSE
jgi:hypothetical protein